MASPNIYRCQFCPCSFNRLSSYNAHLTLRHVDYSSNGPLARRRRQRIVLPDNPSDIRNVSVDNTSSVGINIAESAKQTTEQITNLIEVADVPQSASVIEETFDNVPVVDPDTNSVQHHKVVRINNVIMHCCSICEKQFKKTSDFVRHMRIHTCEKPFMCQQCGNSFTNKSTLNTHMRVHSGPTSKQHRCHVCRKMFVSSSSLKVHLRIHTGSKPFGCPMCSMSFRTSGHRREHVKRHRKLNKNFQQNKTMPDVDQIEHYVETNEEAAPDEVFQSNEEQTIRQDESRKYKCPQCPKAYKKSDHLQYHVKSSHGNAVRSFSCQICGKSFAMFQVLRNHLRTHAKRDVANQQLNCTDNPEALSFYQKSLLEHTELHLVNNNEEAMSRAFDDRYVTGGQGHICFYCGQGFETEEQVHSHVASEHPNTSSQHQQTEALMNPGIGDAMEVSEQSTMMIQNWMPPPDVLPELSLSLLPQSVNVGPEQTGADSLIDQPLQIVTSELPQLATQELPREDEGPGLLEQMAAQQEECPTLIITSGNVQQSDMTTILLPPSSPINDLERHNEGYRRNVHLQLQHQQHQQQLQQKALSNEFRCALCGAVFNTKQSISRHFSDMHSNRSSFECDSCHRKLASSKAHLLHVSKCKKRNDRTLSGEENSVSEPPELTSGSSKTCKFCNRSFSKPSDLQRHERTHTGDRPFRCDQCGKSFRLKAALVGHQNTHLPAFEKTTFSCHLCKAQLGSKSSLVVHLRRHTGATPYNCPHCSEQFSTTGKRQSHILSCHLEALQQSHTIQL